jgi:hypothetical protein
VQVLARVLDRARVGIHSDGLTPDDISSAHLHEVPDIGAAVDRELGAAGPHARVCVLPEGPQTIPFVREPAAV